MYRNVSVFFIFVWIAIFSTALQPFSCEPTGGIKPVKVPVLDSVSVDLNGQASQSSVSQSLQLLAVGHYSDGTLKNISQDVTWVSSDTSIALASDLGLVQGVSAGTVEISAQVADFALKKIVTSEPLTLTFIPLTNPADPSDPADPVIIDDARLTRMRVSIGGQIVQSNTKTLMEKNESRSYLVTAFFSDGSSRNVTSEAKWTGLSSNIVSIQNGQIKALRDGGTSGSVSFTHGDITVALNLAFEVKSKVLVTFINLTIELADASTFRVGEERGIKVYALYSDRDKVDVTNNVNWFVDGQSLTSNSVISIENKKIKTNAVGTLNLKAGYEDQNTTLQSPVKSISIREKNTSELSLKLKCFIKDVPYDEFMESGKLADTYPAYHSATYPFLSAPNTVVDAEGNMYVYEKNLLTPKKVFYPHYPPSEARVNDLLYKKINGVELSPQTFYVFNSDCQKIKSHSFNTTDLNLMPSADQVAPSARTKDLTGLHLFDSKKKPGEKTITLWGSAGRRYGNTANIPFRVISRVNVDSQLNFTKKDNFTYVDLNIHHNEDIEQFVDFGDEQYLTNSLYGEPLKLYKMNLNVNPKASVETSGLDPRHLFSYDHFLFYGYREQVPFSSTVTKLTYRLLLKERKILPPVITRSIDPLKNAAPGFVYDQKYMQIHKDHFYVMDYSSRYKENVPLSVFDRNGLLIKKHDLTMPNISPIDTELAQRACRVNNLGSPNIDASKIRRSIERIIMHPSAPYLYALFWHNSPIKCGSSSNMAGINFYSIVVYELN